MYEFSFNNTHISSFRIKISDIYKKLSSLKTDSGPGPDGIPPTLLKSLSFILSRPLFHIFNCSLATSTFPNFWKVSFLTPIHKTGDRSLATNYRPISILSVIPKVFESLFCDFLSPILDPVLNDHQFGFRPRRSTEGNLLTHIDYLSNALENGHQVDTIYTDFSKAFDRVSHDILLNKLRVLGLNAPLLLWLRSYLCGRRQIVRIANFYSYEIEIPSGVPQGSHLGPLLFNVFINDIQECFSHSQFQLFADDLKFSSIIANESDHDKLQYDLNNLVDWCQRNGMSLNPEKCKTLSVYRGRYLSNFNYSINGVILESSTKIKDLGVTLDSSLNFVSHVASVVSMGFQMLGFIKRCTVDFTGIAAIKRLYCSLVLPHLTYASCVWSPCYAIHRQSLERVQHKFLKYAAFKMNIIFQDDEQMLSILGLPSVLVRHQIRDLQLLYNILHNRSSIPELLQKINIRVPLRVTRSTPSFFVPTHRTNYSHNNFLSRASRLANAHSQIDMFSTHQNFQRQLRVDFS